MYIYTVFEVNKWTDVDDDDIDNDIDHDDDDHDELGSLEAADFCDASFQKHHAEHELCSSDTELYALHCLSHLPCRPPSEPSEARRARRLTEYTWVHSGIKQGYIQVHSGTFGYIQDFSMTSPLTGDLGNREKYKYTWVHSVQPPQPYIILEGGGETRKEERAQE